MEEVEKPFITTHSSGLVKNPWIVIKFKYYEYVVPSHFMNMVMELFSNMEELEDKKIRPLDNDSGNHVSVKFLSDEAYRRYKANHLLTQEVE